MKRYVLIFIFLFPQISLAQSEEVDHLALAKLLVRDGNYARGESSLKQVKTDDKKELAEMEFLWALLSLNKKKYDKTLQHIDRSIELGLDSQEIYIYQAEAFLNLKKYQQALAALEKVSLQDKRKLPYFLIGAEVHWQQGQKAQAWQWLKNAENQKLSANIITKKKFSYFIDEKLYHAAYEMAFRFLENPKNKSDVLAMASQLRQHGQLEFALPLLQALKVIDPKNERVALEMAQVYLTEQKVYSAALVMEESAKHNVSLAYEAGELLRQVGKTYRAEFLNMAITDPEKNLKQKLALYLEDDNYHSLKYLLPQLNKYKLMEDQKIRYAVSYALFRTGDFKKAETMLSPINEEGLFEKTIELKREIQKCQNEEWACVETI